VQPIRLITSELTGILDGIVEKVLQSAGDIEVLARARNRAELIELLRTRHPDVVILGLESTTAADIGWELYVGDPMLRVIGIVADGRQAFVYELRPHRMSLGELSPDDLVTVVRRVADARIAAAAGGGVR
jgi:DNA-binding NarL/FixJ family response regulator